MKKISIKEMMERDKNTKDQPVWEVLDISQEELTKILDEIGDENEGKKIQRLAKEIGLSDKDYSEVVKEALERKINTNTGFTARLFERKGIKEVELKTFLKAMEIYRIAIYPTMAQLILFIK